MRTRVFQAANGREAVAWACQTILSEGREVEPRGQKTLELSPVLIEVYNPADTLPTGINREKLHLPIAAAEALQNVAGVTQPHLMSRISKFFPKPTGRWGEGIETYGPRLYRQMDDVVSLLRRDPSSREGVATIWRAGDLQGQPHNLCTVSLQFLLRGGRLDMIVNMRSNDAWYGLCYDLFQFAQVQLTAARCLDVQAGTYFHHAASLHLYERHWDPASRVEWPKSGASEDGILGVGAIEGQSWYEARLRAKALLGFPDTFAPGARTPSERWYQSTLARYEPDGT